MLQLLADLEKRNEPYVAQMPGYLAACSSEVRGTIQPAARGRLRRYAVVQDQPVRALNGRVLG